LSYQKQKQYYNTNYYINHPTVRLIDEDAKQIGVMTIEEARARSRDTGLDLVEISPQANPPVVKLISFSKFKYQEDKKRNQEKKKTKGGDLKEIKMTPFIGDGDYQTRLKKAKKFLTTGNKVKLSIKFLGRQITRKEFGYDLANRFTTDLEEIAQPETEAKLMGKILIQIFSKNEKNKTKN